VFAAPFELFFVKFFTSGYTYCQMFVACYTRFLLNVNITVPYGKLSDIGY
jgi:hypothetical protein